jgi:hypothetical protein
MCKEVAVMTEINASLKLNFLARKLPTIMLLLVVLGEYYFIKVYGNKTNLENFFSLQGLIFIIYCGLNYKGCYEYWTSIGGSKKSFYLSMLILTIGICSLFAYAQTFLFVTLVNQYTNLLATGYNLLNIKELAVLPFINIWLYHLFYFMIMMSIGNFFGTTRIKLDYTTSYIVTIIYSLIIGVLLIFFYKSNGYTFNMLLMFLFYVLSICTSWKILKLNY